MPRLVQPMCLAEECGNSLVEYAIVLLLLFTMLFGICGFGHALYAYHFVSHAAKSATRWAAVNGSTCADDNSCISPALEGAIRQYVTNMAPPGINTDPTVLKVTPTWPSRIGPCATVRNAPGCPVEVQVSYTFNFIFPLVSSAPLTVSSSSEMVIAH
jgi:Flp pilus assembly protein TadG